MQQTSSRCWLATTCGMQICIYVMCTMHFSRWLWRVRSWQLSGMLGWRCCQLAEERVPSCWIMQLCGQQHIWKASCLPKLAWIGSEQLGEVHNLTLIKFAAAVAKVRAYEQWSPCLRTLSNGGEWITDVRTWTDAEGRCGRLRQQQGKKL